MSDIDRAAAARLADIRARIAHAASLAGRKVEAIELIAISKTKSADAIAPLIAAGQASFGENRVQEAEAKWPALQAGRALRLHLVGQLQSNKAKEAVALFDAIHSVDRPSLIEALARAIDGAARRPDCFVQVNIGEEAQKGGLMAVPPAEVEPAPYFALLAKLAARHALGGLSMGMSSDFETAVMLGATHVRVGTALFGERG